VSKPTTQSLIIPSESGWEIWTRQAGGAFTLHQATTETRPGKLVGIPSGDLLMCFPVKAVTALPMKVASDDDSLFDDLATLHAERLGLRPDPMAGQLTDLFVIERQPESTTLVEILLRAPRDGEMPPRGPKGFDISPRAYPEAASHSLALWKEFGRWVFAIHHAGKLVYCQATANDSSSPDDALAREIRLALIQLEIQGMAAPIPTTLVLSENPEIDTRQLASALRTHVTLAPRPAPVWPEPSSRLLPADVRAARREAAKKRTIFLGAAASAAVYLGLIGYLAFGLWQDKSQTNRITRQIEEIGPVGDAVETHYAKWDELALAIDLNHDPVDILSRIHRSIPANTGLRLKTADISAAQIKLIGEAPQSRPVQQFSLALSRNNELATFTWQNPDPQEDAASGWKFVFSGTSTIFNPQP
jgi:hypothetical protein